MRQATQMEPTLLKLFAALLVLVPTAAFAENTVPFPDYPDPTHDCRRMATGINGNDRFLTIALRKRSATIISRRRFGLG
jgi:hypothetical protein